MKPLIDADVLRYEIGFSGQVVDKDSGELVICSFEKVAEMLDQKIKEICAEVWSTEPPVLYLTNDRRLHKKVNKARKKEGKEELEYIPNFRDEVAEKKVYKGTRKAEKPFHYDNLTAYMLATYDCRVAVGMEADDLLSIDQWARVKEGNLDTIICSRDKDLRITPGMHFGWPCGKQLQFGPARVSELGELELRGGKKLVGTGLKFFYSQLITGDTVDNVPGLPRGGPALAFNSLNDCTSEAELFDRVAALYLQKYPEDWRKEMNEQAQLLWMVRELDEEGSPIKYVMFDERVGHEPKSCAQYT